MEYGVNVVPAGNDIIGSAAPIIKPTSAYVIGAGWGCMKSAGIKGMLAE